jgi:hypothetical protein
MSLLRNSVSKVNSIDRVASPLGTSGGGQNKQYAPGADQRSFHAGREAVGVTLRAPAEYRELSKLKL